MTRWRDSPPPRRTPRGACWRSNACCRNCAWNSPRSAMGWRKMQGTNLRLRIIDACSMSDSLREQLLKAGFAPPRKEPERAPEKREHRDRHTARPHDDKAKKPPRAHDVDLARAYAIRAQAEKSEREAAQ